MLDLHPFIPPAVLGATVSEAQLLDVHNGRLVPQLAQYWKDFSPHLQQRYEVSSRGEGRGVPAHTGPGPGPGDRARSWL